MDERRVQDVPLFATLSKSQRRVVAQHADEVDITVGRRLMVEGENAYEFFLVQAGTAEVTRGGERIAELGPGDLLGEAGAMSRGARNATVVATSAMRAIVMTAQDLRHLAHDAPDV